MADCVARIKRKVKPIFHCKLRWCCVTNANEKSTNNMKCSWLTHTFCVEEQMQHIFQWLVLGFCIGGNANFMFRVGGNANFRVFRYMLVSQTRNCGVGGLSQHQDPT